MKPIRLQVQMLTIGLYTIRGRSAVGDVEQLVETMVFALRRMEFKGAVDEQTVRVLAFVPEQFRAHLRQIGRLIAGERVWCFASVADNKKSLAPFMASGDREWKPEASNMSAHAYIQYADIPDALIASSRQRVESETGAKLISLDGCPITGQVEVTSHGCVQVEFSWPHLADLRHALSDWFTQHGIHFTVVM